MIAYEKLCKSAQPSLVGSVDNRGYSESLEHVDGRGGRFEGKGSGGAAPHPRDGPTSTGNKTLGRRWPGRLLSCPTGRLCCVPSYSAIDTSWKECSNALLGPVARGGVLCV